MIVKRPHPHAEITKTFFSVSHVVINELPEFHMINLITAMIPRPEIICLMLRQFLVRQWINNQRTDTVNIIREEYKMFKKYKEFVSRRLIKNMHELTARDIKGMIKEAFSRFFDLRWVRLRM